jgi:SNF2 family DNA or RNA helicase
MTWMLDSYEQAIGRIARQGNEAETVVVHSLVAEDTLDEAVIESLAGKAKTQSELNEALTRKIQHGRNRDTQQ